MMIKKKGDTGSALSLVLIFVTIAGLAIASLIFVTQISTFGVHQLSLKNKTASASSAVTADILARFQKDPTLGTAIYDPTLPDTANCGLSAAEIASINSVNSSLSFVSCLPVVGGGQYTTTTVGTSVGDGTTITGKISSNNSINSKTTINLSSGASLTAATAQENVTCATSGKCSGTKDKDPSITQTDPVTTPTVISDCATYESTCKMPISYWVSTHTLNPTLPIWSCPSGTSSVALTLLPGEYNADTIQVLNWLTDPSESGNYKRWVKNGNIYDPVDCSNSRRNAITLIFSDGEYIFSGSTPLVIDNPYLTIRNSNTKVKMCTDGYKGTGTDKKDTKCTNSDIDSQSQSWTHTGIKQYSCDYSSVYTAWDGPLKGGTSNANFSGSRIFFNNTDFTVSRGNIYLCGTNFPTAKVLNNFGILALDTPRVNSCKILLAAYPTLCPSLPTRSINITFGSSSHVHIGGGLFVPNAKVTTSETNNKHHTWDRELTGKSIDMTCSYNAGNGCEHNVDRNELGRNARITLKSIDNEYYTFEININEYDSKSVIRRIDNK